MMMKSKTRPARRLRVLAAVPAAALAAMLLGVPAVSNAVKNISSSRLLSMENVSADKVTNSDGMAQGPGAENTASVEKPDELPKYPGGEAALMAALCEAVKYPEEACKNNIQGKVVVGFTVEADGSLSDFKIVKSVNELLDAEALRAVSSMNTKWTPGKKDGKPVACSFSMPVSFTLK